MHRLAASLALTALVLGCPERPAPERGVRLTYRKPEGARDVRVAVDKRLAHAKVRARLQEDEHTLQVLVPDGAAPSLVKALVAQRGKLEFCAMAEADAQALCARAWEAPVTAEQDSAGCRVTAPSRRALDAQLQPALRQGDAGVEYLVGSDASRAAVWAVERPCLQPKVTRAEPSAAEFDPRTQVVSVTLDSSGARAFRELTARLLHKRLLILVDDAVLVAPVVQQEIPGGRAALTLQGSAEEAAALAAALAGGELPALTLEAEARYGPPSLAP